MSGNQCLLPQGSLHTVATGTNFVPFNFDSKLGRFFGSLRNLTPPGPAKCHTSGGRGKNRFLNLTTPEQSRHYSADDHLHPYPIHSTKSLFATKIKTQRYPPDTFSLAYRASLSPKSKQNAFVLYGRDWQAGVDF
eukprot:1244444-Rhodomonas_salina.2